MYHHGRPSPVVRFRASSTHPPGKSTHRILHHSNGHRYRKRLQVLYRELLGLPLSFHPGFHTPARGTIHLRDILLQPSKLLDPGAGQMHSFGITPALSSPRSCPGFTRPTPQILICWTYTSYSGCAGCAGRFDASGPVVMISAGKRLKKSRFGSFRRWKKNSFRLHSILGAAMVGC